MKNLQKMGGIAALYQGAAYIIGIVGFLLVVNISEVVDPLQKVAVLVENQAFLYTMHLIVFIFCGAFLVPLALGIHDRLKAGAPAMMQIATVFGLIWACVVIASGMIYNVGIETVANLYSADPAQAATVWLAIESVFDGLGGGNEIIGGIWILLISWAALRTGGLPKALNYLGLAISAAGILSAVPVLGDLGLIFGLGQIVWFIWVGIVMLRGSKSAAA